MNRRTFLVRSAAATAAVAGIGACAGGRNASRDAERKSAGSMTMRRCGDDEVSLLGYGCMRWPFIPGPDGQEVIDQETVNKLIDSAIEHGINYFDTAPVYCRGVSEEAAGIALRRHPRDKWKIATKMSSFGRDFGERQREESINMYHESLRRLQVDYIDYYLLHSVGGGGMARLHRNLLDIGLIDFFMEERRQGRIRKLGFSFHGDVAVFDHLLSMHDQVHWDFVQIQMNYVDWHHASGRNVNAEYLYGELHKRGIPAVIMEPLLGGRLANLPEHLSSRLQARRPDDSLASWAFRFCGSYEGVMTILSGMRFVEHIEDNARTLSPLEPCTEDELTLLEEIATLRQQYPLVPCTSCQYCMPCPYGIDIPGVFEHYNNCVTEGLIADGKEGRAYRRARRAYLVSYARELERERRADHCIGCNICTPHCPQQIHIPEEMHRLDRLVESLKLSL